MDRALPGISRGIRHLLGITTTNGRAQNPVYEQARIDNEYAKLRGQELENQALEDQRRLINDPAAITAAAASAAGLPERKVKEYEFNRQHGFPLYKGMDYAKMSGIPKEAAAIINQFNVNRYAGLTNPEGADDFARGMQLQMETDIARNAAQSVTDPNAQVELSRGNAYTPFRIQDSTVINQATGDLGPTTEVGRAAIDNLGSQVTNRERLTDARIGTEGARQDRLGRPTGRGGSGGGYEYLKELPPARRYIEARKLAIKEHEALLVSGMDPEDVPTLDEIADDILTASDTFGKPQKSSRGTENYDQALDYAYGRDPKLVTKELRSKGWSEGDITSIITRSESWKRLKEAAAKLAGADKEKKQAFYRDAKQKGWSDSELQKAIQQAGG